MAFTIVPDRPLLDEVQRVARDQLATAIGDLTEPGDDLERAVHDCRKRCKKLRGLIRLIRPVLGRQYREANTTFRDAARHLSPLRDAHALAATFDDLCRARRPHLPADRVDRVVGELRARAARASERATADAPAVAAAVALLREGGDLIGQWVVDEDGFDGVAGGLAKTYRRGRRALARAIEAPTSENFHEYRKRTKYTWYHVRLLGDLAPSITDPLEASLHGLSDTLGDEHDLAVLADQLQADRSVFGGDDQVDAALLVLDGQRADLRRRAVSLGSRLHAESEDAFVDRFAAYWAAWHRHGEELEVGEIADLDLSSS